MEKVTSYVHLMSLIQTDFRYKWLVILEYYRVQNRWSRLVGPDKSISNPSVVSFNSAIKWTDKWIESNVKPDSDGSWYHKNCQSIIRNFNDFIPKVIGNDEFKKEPLP